MSLSQQTLFERKYVTIATDISCDSTYKVCTWACWIRYGSGVIKRSGVFQKYPKDTCRAETYALINALTIAYKVVPDWGESRVIIHNEIERVLTPLTRKNGELSKAEYDRTAAILNLAMPILDKAESWERRKIKAHMKDWQNAENPKKYFINRWCDIESRRLMRQTRKEVKRARKLLDTTT